MNWTGRTLEQALRAAFEENREFDLLGALKTLPPEKREYYRSLWTELNLERAQKKNGMANEKKNGSDS